MTICHSDQEKQSLLWFCFLRLKIREFFELKNKNKVFIPFSPTLPPIHTAVEYLYICVPFWRPLTYYRGKNKDGKKGTELKHIKGSKIIRTWWQFIGYDREGSAKDNSKKVSLKASLRQETEKRIMFVFSCFLVGN